MAPHSFPGRPYNDLSMRIGVFTALLSKFPLDQVLDKLEALDIHTVELGTGNLSGRSALPVIHAQRSRWLCANSSRSSTIAAFPSARSARTAIRCIRIRPWRKLIRRPAAKPFAWRKSSAYLWSSISPDVPATATRPSILTGSPVRGRLSISISSQWQWEKKVEPYWIRHAQFAKDHGVKIAIEMHPGFVVYSPETLLKLRAIAGPCIGCNYDPSHMFWQGIDPIQAIRILGDSIFHVHAKDTQLYDRESSARPACWTPRNTPTSATALGFFAPSATAIPKAGGRSSFLRCGCTAYDYVLSIEHEDSILSPEEGLAKAAVFLNEIVIKRPAG